MREIGHFIGGKQVAGTSGRTGDVFDPGTAQRLADTILRAGGSREAADLYTAFRGRMPGVEALLEQRGLAQRGSLWMITSEFGTAASSAWRTRAPISCAA